MKVDALVVGGGLAGLYAVLHLPADWTVAVVDKGAPAGSSPLAQGGMAVAAGPDDTPELHAADTIRAGAGCCDEAAVRVLCEQAPPALEHLVALGCDFNRSPDGSFDLNREGGQTVARSVRRDDATGRELMRVVRPLAAARARRIEGMAVRLAVSDGRCVGARVLSGGEVVDVRARTVLLATGGCGALYDATTNTAASTGDAVALAYEAGAAVQDLEFVQFHPTALAMPGVARILLTEALRGDGAIVVDADGKRFLYDHHPDGELALRDVVARAIVSRGGAWLDARPIGDRRLRERFPNVYAAALAAGHDLARGPVPVAPAAHYWLGGVAADIDGRTTLPGLYAAGECAASSVHGANRMAGNSLTEAVVFGRRAAIAMSAEAADGGREVRVPHARDGTDGDAAWTELRTWMSEGAGLVRSAQSLARARIALEAIARDASGEALRLAAVAGSLICRAADARTESRGTHFRSDAPAPSEAWERRHTVLRVREGSEGRPAKL